MLGCRFRSQGGTPRRPSQRILRFGESGPSQHAHHSQAGDARQRDLTEARLSGHRPNGSGIGGQAPIAANWPLTSASQSTPVTNAKVETLVTAVRVGGAGNSMSSCDLSSVSKKTTPDRHQAGKMERPDECENDHHGLIVKSYFPSVRCVSTETTCQETW